MADLKEITARLADIGRVKPSDAARQKVKEALGSKWEGVQAAAAKTLARWGDRASVTMLREFLVQTYGRGHGLAIRGVAVHCLAQCVSEEDARIGSSTSTSHGQERLENTSFCRWPPLCPHLAPDLDF